MMNDDATSGRHGLKPDSTLILGFAGVLGLAADRLLWAGPGGPGFAIWIALLGAAAVVVVQRTGLEWTRAAVAWSLVATAAATATVFREADIAITVMMFTLLVSASMVVLRAAGARLWNTAPVDHVIGLAMLPVRAAFGIVPVLSDIELPEQSSRRRFAAVGRGALLATPLLFVFGALFASADAGFDRYVGQLAAFVSEEFANHLALVLVFGWIAAGLLSALAPTRVLALLTKVKPPRVGREETAVVMGLLSLLFIAFVALQVGYLFGGRATIEATSGLTLAEYARRGFFELVVVAFFTLAVLLLGDATTSARRVFRPLAAVLVACVLVILASAAQRLALYLGEFGLTDDRVLAAAVMAWLAIVLVLFAATVLRERPRVFASGALVSGIAIAFALVLINPAALVARVNLDRTGSPEAETDAVYLSRLGADAVPVLVARIDELPVDGRCVVAEALLGRWDAAHAPERGLDDWRTWNASHARARDAVRSAEGELRARAAACQTAADNRTGFM